MNWFEFSLSKPDCESSSPKRSSLDHFTTEQTLSHEEETYRLNVTVAVGVDSVEQSLIEGHISLSSYYEDFPFFQLSRIPHGMRSSY